MWWVLIQCSMLAPKDLPGIPRGCFLVVPACSLSHWPLCALECLWDATGLPISVWFASTTSYHVQEAFWGPWNRSWAGMNQKQPPETLGKVFGASIEHCVVTHHGIWGGWVLKSVGTTAIDYFLLKNKCYDENINLLNFVLSLVFLYSVLNKIFVLWTCWYG